MDLADRQALLAAPDTARRLSLELDLLRRESGLLRELPSLPGTEYSRQPAPPTDPPRRNLRWGTRGPLGDPTVSCAVVAQTPATVALTRAKVPYTLHAYEHDPAAGSYGLEAAAVARGRRRHGSSRPSSRTSTGG